MKLSIFINYFNPAYIFQNRYLIPIQVGKALATEDLRILGDDAADENISTKNPQFCELTGQYYVWKNVPDLDYYGFVHYRRFFDFTESPNRSIDVHGVIVEAAASDAVLSEYGLDEVTLENAIRGFDLILPHPYDVAQAGAKSVREQYLTAPHHFIEDLDEAERVIAEKSPAFSPFFRRTMEGRLLYPNNMFVMRASIFREYSAWLFDVLFELERRIDVRGRTWQEKRAIGYIAERLFSVYAMKLRHDEEIKTKYLHRVFIANAAPPPTGPELPDSSLPVVTVAASTDNAYVQHM